MARSAKKDAEPVAWKPTGDPLSDRISHECANAIAWWLDGRGYLGHPIKSLSKTDLVCMAWAAIVAYTDVREEERRRLGLSQFGEDDEKLDQVIRQHAPKSD